MNKTTVGLALCTVGALLIASSPAGAQDFPRKPINIIYPVALGGPGERLLRPIMQKASETLGQPLLLDPRPGGNGVIGAVATKRSTPDGYTIFMGHSAIHAINQFLIKDLPYDPVKDFKPITTYANFTQVLVVSSKSQAKTMADIVAAAKATRGGLTYGSAGVGTASHLNGEMLRAASGAPFTHVTYKGTAQIYLDLLEDRVDMYFTQYLLVAPYIKEGRMRALATTAHRRIAVRPDLPTMAEAGYPTEEVRYWYGLLAPAGTPDAIVNIIYSALAKAIRDPAIANFLESEDSGGGGITPAEFSALIASDTAKYGKLIKAAGIKLE